MKLVDDGILVPKLVAVQRDPRVIAAYLGEDVAAVSRSAEGNAVPGGAAARDTQAP